MLLKIRKKKDQGKRDEQSRVMEDEIEVGMNECLREMYVVL